MTYKLLTLRQVSDMLGTPIKTLYDWAPAGKLPGAVKLNGSWRVREDKLKKWIEINEVLEVSVRTAEIV